MIDTVRLERVHKKVERLIQPVMFHDEIHQIVVDSIVEEFGEEPINLKFEVFGNGTVKLDFEVTEFSEQTK